MNYRNVIKFSLFCFTLIVLNCSSKVQMSQGQQSETQKSEAEQQLEVQKNEPAKSEGVNTSGESGGNCPGFMQNCSGKSGADKTY